MVAKLKNQHSLSQKRASYAFAPYASDDLVDAIENNYTRTELRILNEVVKYLNFGILIFIAQATIAKILGLSRKTVNEALQKFKRDGLLAWKRRFNNSNIYEPHPLFRHRKVRKELRFTFKIFYFLSVTILCNYSPLPGEMVPQDYIFSRGLHYKENRNYFISDRTKTTRLKKEFVSDSDKKTKVSNARRGVKMEPKDLKRIKSLNLTRAGEIKLSAFPPEAFEYALIEIRKHDKPISDLFKFTWMLCKRYCENNNHYQDHREVSRILKREGVGFEEDGLVRTDPCILEPMAVVQKKPLKSDSVAKRVLPPEAIDNVNKNIEENRRIRDCSSDINLQDALDSINMMMVINKNNCLV